jgi:uncharacterized protein
VVKADSTKLSRLVRRFLFVVVALYILIFLFMMFFQRSLLYFPKVATREAVDRRAKSAHLERWTNSAGQFIGFKRLSPKQPATGVVMITYGNGSTAVGCNHYAQNIQAVAPFDVFILEYPGYQDRPGPPTQTAIFAAASEAFQTLQDNRPIYLLGESLGTGVASYLAGTFTNRIAALLLISPFSSVADVAKSRYIFLPVDLLLADKFPSEDYLRPYHGKVGITVDGKDLTVPERFSRRLYEGYSGPKKLWEFPTGRHIQIVAAPEVFWPQVIAFWQK